MANHLFREGSLEKLHSPEQLDKLLVVIKPKGWIALICLLTLLCVVLVWAALATIPVQITMRGLINTPKQFFTIRSLSEGSVIEIKVKKGDFIEIGQPLFMLYSSKEKENTYNIQNGNKILPSPFDFKALNEMKEGPFYTVISPVRGTIFRLDVNLQDFVKRGSPLLYVSQALEKDEHLQAFAYVPVTLQGHLKEGMNAEVEVRGKTFLGKVAAISPYSLSRAEIFQGIPSEKWLDYLTTTKEPVLEIIIAFDEPPSSIQPGDLCQARITVAEKKPLKFLIP